MNPPNMILSFSKSLFYYKINFHIYYTGFYLRTAYWIRTRKSRVWSKVCKATVQFRRRGFIGTVSFLEASRILLFNYELWSISTIAKIIRTPSCKSGRAAKKAKLKVENPRWSNSLKCDSNWTVEHQIAVQFCMIPSTFALRVTFGHRTFQRSWFVMIPF